VKVVLTARALRELKQLHKHISRDSVMRANDMVARILRRTQQLSEFPRSGRRVPEFGFENLREVVEPPYRIIYRIKGELVEVASVLHSSRKLR
jgi:toxin ParE1/3/4